MNITLSEQTARRVGRRERKRRKNWITNDNFHFFTQRTSFSDEIELCLIVLTFIRREAAERGGGGKCSKRLENCNYFNCCVCFRLFLRRVINCRGIFVDCIDCTLLDIGQLQHTHTTAQQAPEELWRLKRHEFMSDITQMVRDVSLTSHFFSFCPFEDLYFQFPSTTACWRVVCLFPILNDEIGEKKKNENEMSEREKVNFLARSLACLCNYFIWFIG